MSAGSRKGRDRNFVAIYRCDVVTSEFFIAVCGDVKVELFREARTYTPSAYHNLVIATVEGAEYCSPVLPRIELDTRSKHLMLTTRTLLGKTESQETCERAIDRVVALMSALYSPDLFRVLLYRGWLQGPASANLGVLVKAVNPIAVDGKNLGRAYNRCSLSIANNLALRDRFSLMSNFVSKGLAEPPGEESFVWLWTALEVFPMVNTADIRPISEFLSTYVGHPPAVVKEKLKIGWLCGMRSKLIHNGHLPLDREERFEALSSLERLVHAVVRHASGLPHDGALNFAFC